jgi:hypothetical protein
VGDGDLGGIGVEEGYRGGMGISNFGMDEEVEGDVLTCLGKSRTGDGEEVEEKLVLSFLEEVSGTGEGDLGLFLC